MLTTSSYLDMNETTAAASGGNGSKTAMRIRKLNQLRPKDFSNSHFSQSEIAASHSTLFDDSYTLSSRTRLASKPRAPAPLASHLNRSGGLDDGATSFDDESRMNFSDGGETAALLILAKQRASLKNLVSTRRSSPSSIKSKQTDERKSHRHNRDHQHPNLEYIKHLRHNEELLKKSKDAKKSEYNNNNNNYLQNSLLSNSNASWQQKGSFETIWLNGKETIGGSTQTLRLGTFEGFDENELLSKNTLSSNDITLTSTKTIKDKRKHLKQKVRFNNHLIDTVLFVHYKTKFASP